MKCLLVFCLLFFTIAVAEIIPENPDGPAVVPEIVPEESHPVSTALMAHVQENGLQQVMRVKRYCGCCGGCCGCGCMCASMAPATGCPCMGCCG